MEQGKPEEWGWRPDRQGRCISKREERGTLRLTDGWARTGAHAAVSEA
jgi:hypothetical protein